jgi:hypothetical protein
MDKQQILNLAEVHETGVDEQERHIFSDEDLTEFVRAVLAEGVVMRHRATDRMRPIYEAAVRERTGVSILMTSSEAMVVDRRVFDEIAALAGYSNN